MEITNHRPRAARSKLFCSVWVKEPGVAFNLLRKVAMFSDGIDDYWILLGLFLEQLTSSHLWEAKNLSKIGVLVSSELSYVSFGNFLQSELLLNFCQMLCSLALTSLFYSLPSGIFLLLSHLLSHLWFM